MTERKNSKMEATESNVSDVAQLALEEGKKIAKKDFAIFSAIVTVIFSAGLWVIKSLWYAYMSGRFSVYKIDMCYINANNENVFLQIIQLVAIFIAWFFINYIYYKISVTEDKSRFRLKKKIKIFAFWIVEMIIVFASAFFSTRTQIRDLFAEITIEKVVALIIVLIFLCLMINIYAIEFLIEKWWKKRKGEKVDDPGKDIKHAMKDMLLAVIVTIAIELIIVFFIAANTEYSRIGYKMIMIQSVETTEDEFTIKYRKDTNKYQMYPVVYENEDCYIVTRLYNKNGEIKIDYNYQRIVEKEGQETIYVENIYNISEDK